MKGSPIRVAGNQEVFYAGRSADRVTDLPGDVTVISEWDVLPARLAEIAESATTIVVLDPFSFPFELLAKVRPDVPLILVLPPSLEAGFLAAVFGGAVFEKLDFFDRVATTDSALWEELRRRYGWAGVQGLRIDGDSPEEAASEVHALLRAEAEAASSFGEGPYEAIRYWTDRGNALADVAPHRAICSVRHAPDFNKAIHRVQGTALRPQFAAARGERAEDVPFDVLEVGTGAGRWASAFDLRKTRFHGVDISKSMVEAARCNYPEASFEVIGGDLVLPYDDESFDLVFCVTVMHHNPTPAKRALLSEMWRVARVGGRLLFLEDFVVGGWTEESTVYPMSVLRFVDLVLEAMNGQVVLEHIESIRYAHDDAFRGGVLALSRLGVPKRL